MAREISGGFEAGGVVADGFNGTGTGGINSTGANQHADRLGNSGTYCLLGSGSSANPSRHIYNPHTNSRALVESWERVHLHSTNTLWVFILAIYSGTTELMSVRLSAVAQTISTYLSTATLLDTTGGGVFPQSRYFSLAVHYRISDTVGLIEVFIDDVLVYTYSGDTKPGAATTHNTVGYGASFGWLMDEYARNSITMQYDGGSGTAPVVGQTITGGTSGATAVISIVEGDATSGVLVLQQWNETPFLNNEVLTSATLTALVNAPTDSYVNGFEPNSGKPTSGFIPPMQVPTGAGNTTGLTPSTGINNWALVDDIPPNTTDYVYTAVPDTYDTYAKTATLPASATKVIAIMGYINALRDGVVVNNVRHVLRTGGTDYFGTLPNGSAADYAVSTSYSPLVHIWNVNPGTLTEFTVAEVNSGMQPGAQVRT